MLSIPCWTDYKTNTKITNELKITPVLGKLLEYKRNWIKRVNLAADISFDMRRVTAKI